MTDAVTIRPERPHDVSSIRTVVDEAFSTEDDVGPLVERIRASDRYVAALSLVADLDGHVVGHVMFSHADVVDDDGVRRELLTLSPLSVAVAHQRQGIGTLLATTGLALADTAGEGIVVVEGSPAYYPRFGFEPAGRFGITITLPSWAPPEAAMAMPLAAYCDAVRGHVVYPPAFDDVVGH